MLRYIRQVFLKGLIAILPVAVTIYVVIWLATAFESLLGGLLRFLLPARGYVPGMGIVVGVLIVFMVGLMLQMWLTRRLWELGERLLDKMPLVRAVYGALKQMMSYVSSGEGPQGRHVVMVSLGDPPTRMLGLVTSESIGFADAGAEEDTIAVFLPWSYQIGGFTVFVPRSAVVRVDLTPQEAIHLAMTAGVTKGADTGNSQPRRGSGAA